MEEIKWIIKNYSDTEKRFENLLKHKQLHKNLIRKISTNKKIKYNIGDTITKVGESWSDTNDKNYKEYYSEIYGKYTYYFHTTNIQGHKVKYLDIEDEWYQEYLWILNTQTNMKSEAEVLLSNNIKFKIIDIKNNHIYILEEEKE